MSLIPNCDCWFPDFMYDHKGRPVCRECGSPYEVVDTPSVSLERPMIWQADD